MKRSEVRITRGPDGRFLRYNSALRIWLWHLLENCGEPHVVSRSLTVLGKFVDRAAAKSLRNAAYRTEEGCNEASIVQAIDESARFRDDASRLRDIANHLRGHGI